MDLFRNLSEWMRRSGAAVPSHPLPYAEHVQPVEVLADVSRLTLTRELWGQAGYAGCHISPNLEDLAFELQAQTPGGLVVRSLSVTCSQANQDFGWTVRADADTTWGAGYPFVCTNLGPVNAVARFGIRTSADRCGDVFPSIRNLNVSAIPVPFEPGIYVPPGGTFYVENPYGIVTASVRIAVSWFELLVR